MSCLVCLYGCLACSVTVKYVCGGLEMFRLAIGFDRSDYWSFMIFTYFNLVIAAISPSVSL